jgi:hypothetical protein
MNNLDRLRARLRVGDFVTCIENTLRPKLNGSRRRITAVSPSAFNYDVVDGTRRAIAYLPLSADDVTWLDEHTVRYAIDERANTVTIAFEPPAPKGSDP